jgi:hypothetical protein
VYCLGSYACNTPNTFTIFILKVIYVLFWTWVLNLICKDGHTGISWFLVLIPFILLFAIVLLLMVSPMQEGLAKKPMSKQVNDMSDDALGAM